MTTQTLLLKARRSMPDLPIAHWFLRVLLSAIMVQQGLYKLPLTAADAESWGVPFALWAMAAIADFAVAALLIGGGLLRNVAGDLMTRFGGLLNTMVVASVLYVVYWAPPMDMFYNNQLHLMMLAGGLLFLFRGNKV